jgi:hypothetical protein
MWKFVCLSRKDNPLLDEVENSNLADLWREHSSQGEKSETRKFVPWGSEMGDWKCNVPQYTGTDGQDETHSLQRSLVIMRKTRDKSGYYTSYYSHKVEGIVQLTRNTWKPELKIEELFRLFNFLFHQVLHSSTINITCCQAMEFAPV